MAINLIGIAITALFLLFILLKKEKQLSDYWLLAYNVTIIVFLFSDWWMQYDLQIVNFILFNLSSVYLFPLLMFYALLLIEGEQQIHRPWWWLFSLAIAFSLFLFFDFAFWTDYQPAVLHRAYTDPTLIYHFFYKGNFIFTISVLSWFLRQLRHYRQRIKNFYSSIETLRLQWLTNFAWVYLLVNVVTLLSYLAYNVRWVNDIEQVLLLTNGVMVTGLFYLSFHGIRQYSTAEFQREEKGTDSAATSPSNIKYRTSALSEEDLVALYQGFTQLLEGEELYREPQLKIQQVAERLSTSSHKLSQAINTKAGQSFFELVNSYRVAHFKRSLLQDNRQSLTILAQGLDSGFNSKASLNRIFKSHTGMTPREFQKSQHPE